MDTSALADQLGITAKTVRTRARALGISGTQAKTQGKEGRPGVVYSPEECQRIADYGKPSNAVSDGDLGDEEQSVEHGAMALQQTIAAPILAQFGAIASQLDHFEEQAANALAKRVSAVPHRILSRTAQKLAGQDLVNLSEVFGMLTTPVLPVRTIEVNLGAPLYRQDSLKASS